MSEKLLCSIEGCDRPKQKRGWCSTHYSRWRRTGSLGTTEIKTPAPKGVPAVEIMEFHGWDITETNCWEYRGSRFNRGYSQVKTQVENGGNPQLGHRVMYRSRIGELSDAEVIRHKCDNPPCVNPEHLEPGTHADNARDRATRGRSAKPKAMFSESEVLLIRNACPRQYWAYSKVAKEFGCGLSTIQRLVLGVTYADVVP